MHFQLLFPGKTANAPGCLRSVGLADFVDGATEMAVMGKGLLVAWGDKIGLDPEKQRWVDSGEGYQVGFWVDEPCTPNELARTSLFSGYMMTLGDGQRWQAPVAAMLPQTYKLRDGKWHSVRKPQFAEYWDRSAVWFRRMMVLELDEAKIMADAKISAEQLLQEWIDFCVFALRQNYRVTPFIASELGLLDTETKLQITFAAVDRMAIAEVLAEASGIAELEASGLPKKDEQSATPDS